MNTITRSVLALLDDCLRLKGRAVGFDDTTPLLGVLPELDSMAMAVTLTGLEDHFGIAIEDDEVDRSVFETVGSLSAFVERKLAQAA